MEFFVFRPPLDLSMCLLGQGTSISTQNMQQQLPDPGDVPSQLPLPRCAQLSQAAITVPH